MSDPFDIAAVEAWLSRQIAGFSGPVTVRKFDTGQSNPTFRLDTPGASYVLRRKPPGQLLKSAHAVDREYRVQAALADTDVPVPRMIALCEDEDVVGSMFYVMEHVAGRNFEDPRLPDVSVVDRAAMVDEMNRVLAAIHSVDVEGVRLSNFGAAGDYYARQIGRWTKQYRASETEPMPEMDMLIDWLEQNLPEDDGRRTLVHGDFRLDNLLFDETGTACRAVLDWELSTLGHPFADLAAVIMQWHRPPGNEGRGLAGVDRAALGLPSDAAFIDAYCARMGLDGIPRFGFYLAFTNFRMAAILQGVKKRALDGNASSPERALKVASFIPDFVTAGRAAAQEAEAERT